MRKISRKGLMNKAWTVFSEFVRKRGMDANGINVCVTCGKRDHWKNLHAGHFYHGKGWLSYMDECNVHPQCNKCNTYLGGNLIEYSEFVRKIYGNDIIDILRELRHTPWKPSRSDLEAIIEKYKGDKSEKNNYNSSNSSWNGSITS